MRMAMLARNPNLYSHKRLVEAAVQRGHEMDIFNTLRCYMNITSHRPEVKYDGKVLSGYDVVVPRIGASVTYYGLAVLRQFEMMGVYPMNESVAIGRSARQTALDADSFARRHWLSRSPRLRMTPIKRRRLSTPSAARRLSSNSSRVRRESVWFSAKRFNRPSR